MNRKNISREQNTQERTIKLTKQVEHIEKNTMNRQKEKAKNRKDKGIDIKIEKEK